MSTAARRVGRWNCPTGTSRAHGDRRTAVSEDDAELVMLQALFILDTFLNTSRGREFYSKTELMNLALDMRACLKGAE